jgi:hypothetical protein
VHGDRVQQRDNLAHSRHGVVAASEAEHKERRKEIRKRETMKAIITNLRSSK